MDRKLLLLCFSFALTFLNVGTTQAASHCTGLDIAFSNVALTGVGNGMITYNVTIHNIGTQAIAFNKLTLKNYVSTDNTYDRGDVSGGSALFSSFATGTSLAAGQQKTATYHANYSGDIKTLPYLILQLSYQDAECDAGNNEIVVCTKPNPVLNDIAISHIETTYGLYNASISNTGGDTLFLSKTVLQNYVSTNNTTHQAPAGGSILDYGDKKYLVANETYVLNDFGFYVSNTSNYSYVFANLYYTASACGSGNEIVKPLVVTVTSTEDAQDKINQAIIWDMSTHSFVAKSEGQWSGRLTYQVFDAAGRLLEKGSASPGERVYLQEGLGLAILTVADDRHVLSKRIVR